MNALNQAGARVFEPVNQFELEVLIEGTIPARNVPAFGQRLPRLSQGEGIVLTRFHSFRPVTGPIPTRRRTDHNPLDGREYLLHALGRI